MTSRVAWRDAAVGDAPLPIAASILDAAETALDRAFQALREGRTDALEDIVHLTLREVYALALWRTGKPEDAADVAQETYVRLLERASGLRRVRRPRGYVLTIAHRIAIDVVRRRGRSAAEPLETVRFVEAEGSGIEALTEARRASELLARLPETQRGALYLRYFLGMSHAEVGRVTGVPTFTAASRCRVGLAKLRSWLEIES